MDNWEDYQTNFIEVSNSGGLTNSSSLTLGMAYKPYVDRSTVNVIKYSQLCTYRLGLRSNNTNVSIGNEQITDNGINLGITFPLVYNKKQKNSDSHIDFSIEYGEKGRIDDGLIKENYLRAMIGISFHPGFYDRWFIKRKYD